MPDHERGAARAADHVYVRAAVLIFLLGYSEIATDIRAGYGFLAVAIDVICEQAPLDMCSAMRTANYQIVQILSHDPRDGDCVLRLCGRDFAAATWATGGLVVDLLEAQACTKTAAAENVVTRQSDGIKEGVMTYRAAEVGIRRRDVFEVVHVKAASDWICGICFEGISLILAVRLRSNR